MSAFEHVGTVETVKEMKGKPRWLEVKLKEREEVFALHQNWVAYHDQEELKHGARVGYSEIEGDWRTPGYLQFKELWVLGEEEK